jgi:hypothetical protein
VQVSWLTLRRHRRSPPDASLGVPARRGYTARRTGPGPPHPCWSRHTCAIHLGCRDAPRSGYPRDVTLLFLGKYVIPEMVSLYRCASSQRSDGSRSPEGLLSAVTGPSAGRIATYGQESRDHVQ